MSTKNDPAFPWEQSPGNQNNLGLSKLEEFAKAALQGLCANEKLTTEGTDRLAQWAFDQAEAMIAEAEKRK